VLAVRSCANVLEGRHVTMPLANVTVARAEKDFTVKRVRTENNTNIVLQMHQMCQGC
jgi:hypothetical protein